MSGENAGTKARNFGKAPVPEVEDLAGTQMEGGMDKFM